MKGTKTSGPSRDFRSYRPAPFFLLFLAGNSILSYGPWGAVVKVWVFLMMILLPFVLGLITRPGKPSPSKDLVVPAWAWGLVLGAGVFLRFQGLGSIPVWPMWDDADCAYDSIHLMEHWQWSPVSGQIRLPSMFFWMEALLFRCCTPSLFTLWLLPALFSLGGMVWGVLAGRRWSPGLPGFLFAAFVCLGFWPLYMGEFSIPASLAYLWIMGACATFVDFWRSRGKGTAGPAWILGVWCALGLFINSKTYPPILVITLVFLACWWKDKPRDPKGLLPFFLPLMLLGLPEFPVLFFELSRGHAHDFMVFFGPVDWTQQWSVSLSYLTVYLWGVLRGTYFHFGPVWGGFYNPLLGSLLLIGSIEGIRRTRPRVWMAWGAIAVLFLMPGFFSRTLEMFRVLPFLPLGLALAVLGALRLLGTLDPRSRGAVLIFLLLLSMGLDQYHLRGPFHHWCVPGARSMDSKSPERYKAFRILDPLQGQEGPGLVFTEFVPNVFDQSLLTATYPFNALRNRDLDPGKTRWAGVLADVSFRDYFARRFPRSQCYPLYPDLPALEGQLDLFWVPINGPDRAVFGEWAKIHGRIADLFTLLPYHLARPDYGPARDLLEKTLPECGSDAFLELSILDKMRGLGPDSPENFEAKTRLIRQAIQRCGASPDLRTKKGYLWEDLGQVYWNCAHDERAMAAALTQALATGHESAWIYRRLGEWELKNKDYGKALWAFQQYLRLDTANPPPAPLLQWLHERAKPQRILAP